MAMKTLNKEQLLTRGALPWGNTVPPVYLCAQCLTVEINAGVGLCRTCLKMVDDREAATAPAIEYSETLNKLVLIACVMMLALIAFVLAGGGAK